MRALCLAACLLFAPALVQVAHAQQGPIAQRRMGVQWRGGIPRVHFSAIDFADRSVREKLRSGLPQTIVTRVYAYAADGSPVAVELRSCRVAYDLWEEVFRLQVQTSREDVTESHATLESVLARCLVVNTSVGRGSDWSGRTGSFYFAALFELNPLSPDTIQRLRRWLAQPAAGGRVGGEAFYGSFVSLFVNRRIGAAERTFRLRSQTVARP